MTTHTRTASVPSVPLWTLLRRVSEVGHPDLTLLSVYREWGVVRKSDRDDNHNQPSDSLGGYQRVLPGDLVLNKMKTWQGSLGVSTYEGIVSPAYFVCRPDANRVDGAYLHHVLRSSTYIAELGALSKGIRPNQWDLPWEAFRTICIPLPSLDEQRRIANFLNAQVALLDRAIRLQEKRVDLLSEAAEALIGPTVVSSLSGRTPLTKMNRLLVRMSRQPRPGAAMVTAFRDGQVIERSIRTSKGFTDSWTEGAAVQGVASGDVVIHGLDGFAGAIGTSESDGICSPANHVLVPVDGGDSHFYGRLLRVLALGGYLSQFGGSARERAVDFRNWGVLGSIPLPVVDADLQYAVGERLRLAFRLRVPTQQAVLLLQERKQALITAAVSGKFDVSTARTVTV